MSFHESSLFHGYFGACDGIPSSQKYLKVYSLCVVNCGFPSLYKREFIDNGFRTNHSHLLENSYHINYKNVPFPFLITNINSFYYLTQFTLCRNN